MSAQWLRCDRRPHALGWLRTGQRRWRCGTCPHASTQWFGSDAVASIRMARGAVVAVLNRSSLVAVGLNMLLTQACLCIDGVQVQLPHDARPGERRFRVLPGRSYIWPRTGAPPCHIWPGPGERRLYVGGGKCSSTARAIFTQYVYRLPSQRAVALIRVPAMSAVKRPVGPVRACGACDARSGGVYSFRDVQHLVGLGSSSASTCCWTGSCGRGCSRSTTRLR